MPQDELTHKRPTNYSNWQRRRLPRWCYWTDCDYFVQRSVDGRLTAVAAIETIELDDPARWRSYPLWPAKAALRDDIEERMRIPYYVVYHTPQCTRFVVVRGQAVREMPEATYRDWLMHLGR